MKIAVIGDGGWGTANALLLASHGHDVTVWGAFPDYVEEVRKTRQNVRYLPGVSIPSSLGWTADREEAVNGAELVVLAMPSGFYADVCESFKGIIGKDTLVVSLTKGLCEKTHSRMSIIAAKVLGVDNVVVLSGPTHAEEVSRGIPTAIVAASENPVAAQTVQNIWNSPTFRVYTSDDPLGVEFGGAVKNVLAVAVGCSDGLGFGDNTRAALITRGLAEMTRFAVACGAKERTVAGLSGIGDLIVTCTSRHSRNRAVGERMGRGESIGEITSSMHQIAEGVRNSAACRAFAAELGVEMPITEVVYRVCYEGLPVKEAIGALMNRAVKSE